MPFDHGYHHERALVSLSPLAKFLLGLCFCEFCVAAINAEGGQGEKLRVFVSEQLDRHLGGAPSDLDGAEVSRQRVEELAGGDLKAMLAADDARGKTH